jgi:phosphoserine aminotransferase
LIIHSVYIAGQVLKKSLATFPDKVDGQQMVAERKAKLLYDTLDAYPEVYKIVPDKAVRSRMNVCFRVTKVCLILVGHGELFAKNFRVEISMKPRRHS